MNIESIRADGFVNRWSLVALPPVIDEEGNETPGGYEARCIEDAIRVDDPGAPMADARNRAIAEGAATPEDVEKRAQELLASVVLPVPNVISDRQFAHALALVMPDKITQEDALAWAARGDIPPALLEIIDGLPEQVAFAAKMKLAAAVEYHRNDPLVDFVAQQMNVSSAEIDGLWRLAASL